MSLQNEDTQPAMSERTAYLSSDHKSNIEMGSDCVRLIDEKYGAHKASPFLTVIAIDRRTKLKKRTVGEKLLTFRPASVRSFRQTALCDIVRHKLVGFGGCGGIGAAKAKRELAEKCVSSKRFDDISATFAYCRPVGF